MGKAFIRNIIFFIQKIGKMEIFQKVSDIVNMEVYKIFYFYLWDLLKNFNKGYYEGEFKHFKPYGVGRKKIKNKK
jgi:hypothetical protein